MRPTHSFNRKTILLRYAQPPTLDTRPVSEVIAHDEIDWPVAILALMAYALGSMAFMVARW